MICFFKGDLIGQLSGIVTDVKGEPLSYVAIYKKGTSTGTVSNDNGEYSLNLADGKHTLIFKFIGYKELSYEIELSGKRTLDVTLEEESIELEELVFTATGEDPAYRVIRNTIKTRKKNKRQTEKYEVDLYMKGVVKILDAPEKILGMEIGDMEGMLDTTGQGIIYLAESQSKVYFHQPDLIKEEMYSSIVAEDDGAFNFNRFFGQSFDIYDEYFEFGRSLISPIADNAFTYYRYKMIEAKIDDDGRLINRIKVIPKSNERPTLFGEIYIIENSWIVKELDLAFTGKSINESLIDTVELTQVYLPLIKDQWMLFSQAINFKVGMFGFNAGGGFTSVFSNYNLDPEFDRSYFDREEFVMDKSAIKTDAQFWTDVRPIQLTEEERLNYIKKDSLKKVWNSKEYQDSVDRVNNKFVLGDLIFGASKTNTYKKQYFNYSSPLTSYNFNAVEGHSLSVGFDYVKIDSAESKRLNINTKLGYGFSDQLFKADGKITYRTNRLFLEQFSFGIGDSYRQIDESELITPFQETFISLWYKENQMRLFRKRYLNFAYQRELFNGVFVRTGIEYARRSSLFNNTNYSFRSKEELYDPNNSIFFGAVLPFENHTNLEYALDIRFRIGQKYSSYPKFRLRSPSKWPDIWLRYRKGIRLGDTDFDKISLQIKKEKVNLKIYGWSSINIEAGTFLNNNEVTAIDYRHFYTNENFFNSSSRAMNSFRTMPHYTYSTNGGYLAGWYEHVFDGYILDLIPGINKLGLSTVISANGLLLEDGRRYNELAIGIYEIKLFGINLMRFDYVWGFDNDGLADRRFVLGLTRVIEN